MFIWLLVHFSSFISRIILICGILLVNVGVLGFSGLGITGSFRGLSCLRGTNGSIRLVF